MVKQNSVLLLGYSGQRNFGDDLLLQQAYKYLDEASIRITIHTSNCTAGSDYLLKWFPKATIVKSPGIKLSLIKKHTHVLYFGGGVFFEYNEISLKLYLRRRISILKLFNIPKLFYKVKFAGIGIGLGPFVSHRGENLCKYKLKHFDYLNIRDLFSLNITRKWEIKNVSIAPDLSFAFSKYWQSISKTLSLESVEKGILICPRHYPHGKNKNKYLENLLSITSWLISAGYNITVFAFQGNHDENVVKPFEDLKVKQSIWNPDTMSITDGFKLFSENDLVITARMHGIFVAGMVNTPSIAIGLHPKLAYASGFFVNSVSIDDTFTREDFESNFKKINRCDYNNHEIDAHTQKCMEQYVEIVKWIKEDSNKFIFRN